MFLNLSKFPEGDDFQEIIKFRIGSMGENNLNDVWSFYMLFIEKCV